MGYAYTWNGSVDGSWTTLANWDTVAGISPVTGTLTNTSDTTSTVIFTGGPTVDGYGSANFFEVFGNQTFAGDFSADGQTAIGLQNYYTAFQVTAGTATFSGASTHLSTHADVLVGYGSIPGQTSPATLVFSGGATATLNTNNVVDYLGNRIDEFSLYIGYDHAGVVDLEGAGTSVTTDSGVAIGLDTGVSGSLHVGTGAHLEIGSLAPAYGFAVGTYGQGTLLIDGGATVRADGGVNIGAQLGSIGSATVDGAGSDFHAVQAIYVGTPAGGVGSLTVSNGATVESDSSIKVYSGSTLTITNGSTVNSIGSPAGARIQILAGGHVSMGTGSTLSATGTNTDPTLEGIQVENTSSIVGVGAIVGTYVRNDGVIEAYSSGGPGLLVVQSNAKAIADPGTPGVLGIAGDATLELIGGVASSETVVFNNNADAGYHETLKIDGSPSAFQAPIQGLQAGDVIDLTGVTGATTWTLNSTTDVLTVSNDAGATLASLQLLGNYAGVSFAMAADGSGGYALTESKTAKAPVFTSGSGKSAEYVINKGFTAITSVQASGTDVQYFLKDPRTGKLVSATKLFSINTQTGALSFNNAPSYGDYDVTVVAKNAAGQTTQYVDVNVAAPQMHADPCDRETFVFHPGFKTDVVWGFQLQNDVLQLDHTLFAGDNPGESGSTQMHADPCDPETFVFHPGFKTDVVWGFQLQNDVLQFDHTLFAGATLGESGSALIALLAGDSNRVFGGVEINSSTGDHLFLMGVSKQSLLANAATDVKIV